MKIGSLVRNKYRYDGQLFMVVGYSEECKPSIHEPVIRCVRVTDNFKTRWSKVSTWEILA